jgi:hypothetical protein
MSAKRMWWHSSPNVDSPPWTAGNAACDRQRIRDCTGGVSAVSGPRLAAASPHMPNVTLSAARAAPGVVYDLLCPVKGWPGNDERARWR